MRRVIPLLFLAIVGGACSRGPRTHQLVQPDGGGVRILRSEVADGHVHFFTFEQDGKNINFLVRTDGDGVLHAHLDACYACYRYKRGFVVEGSNLVCVACRFEYAISDEVWDYIGACAPISIHASLSRDHLVIDSALLEKAGRYF